MAVPANNLVNVQTYNKSGLATLQNSFAFIENANTKFLNFQDITGNLGSTVQFTKPTRMTTTNSLVATFQPIDQRYQTLTINNQISSAYAFTAEQFILNVEDYMKEFGTAAMEEIGSVVEADVALNCITNTFRFYGDGITPISSPVQLARALALFRNFGAAKNMTRGFLSDIAVPEICNTGQNQFTLKRNDESAMSWEVGRMSRCDWFESNLLRTHTAGNVGNNGALMTVTGTTLDATGAVISITFTVAGAPGVDANAIKRYDKIQFNDNVAGRTNVRFLTFTGHFPSASPVQLQATADAATDGGSSVTINIYPPLQVGAASDQNISTAIVAGMTANVLPSHRAGMIYSGDALYLAMPKLPDQTPFPTANEYDSESGISIRQTYGSAFGQNRMGMIHDAIWGSTMVPEYAMMIAFPL